MPTDLRNERSLDHRPGRQRLEFRWRPGWRTSKLRKLTMDVRAKREDRIARAVTRAAQKWELQPYTRAASVEVLVDLGQGAPHRAHPMWEQIGMIPTVIGALKPWLPEGAYRIAVKPVHGAKMIWTREQKASHLKVARRIKKHRPDLAAKMLRQVFGPAVTVTIDGV